MIETKCYSIVVGCGERGRSWIAQRKSEPVVGLDLKYPKGEHGELIRGDVFNLPIKSGSISKIYADFIVNGLIDREIAASQIYKNPDVLASSYFPPLVGNWFESINRNHDHVRNNVQHVSYLLKTVALREMWRVLAPGGRLQVLDLEKNITWLGTYAPMIVNENPEFVRLEAMHISDEDFDRSASLERLVNAHRVVRKIELAKAYPPLGKTLPFREFQGRSVDNLT